MGVSGYKMNRELQKYYEERFSTMGTQGWRDLMEDAEAMLVSTNSLDGVNDEKTLQFRKGEISILKWLISLKSVSEAAYEELNNARD